MLGLGNEITGAGQVGSSAMPHKRNPITTERVYGLSQLVTGGLWTFSRCEELLEGDVSGSTLRRESLYRLFADTEAMLINWLVALARWVPQTQRMAEEVAQRRDVLASAAIMQWIVDKGHTREYAHEAINQATAAQLLIQVGEWRADRAFRNEIVKAVRVTQADQEWLELHRELSSVVEFGTRPAHVGTQIKAILATVWSK
jgi:adenylosuccinate lyase